MRDGFRYDRVEVSPCFIRCEQKELLLSVLRDVLTGASNDASILCSLFKQQKYPGSRFLSWKQLNGVPEVGVLGKDSAIASAQAATR